MKKILFFGCLFASVLAHGQKLMTAIVETELDEFGTVDYADSTVFSYTTTQGFFNEFKPVFRFEDDVIFYFVPEFIVHANSKDYYEDYGSGWVLEASFTNTLTNNMVTLSDDIANMEREHYEYNAQGLLAKEYNEYFDGSVWEVSDSSLYEYDALGNLTVETQYSVFGSPSYISSVDSMVYQPGTDRLVEVSNYYDNGSALELSYKGEVTYNGGDVEYLDSYSPQSNDSLIWEMRIVYDYLNGNVAGFMAYFVDSNVVDMDAFASGIFTYNAQDDFESYALLFDTDTLGKIEYGYDADGFLNKVSYYAFDNFLYLEETTEYYFANVASVPEVETVEVGIYPNPTSNLLRLKTEEAVSQMQVINLSGQLVMTQNTGQDIDVSHLPTGTYILKGNVGDKVFSQTFVKQ